MVASHLIPDYDLEEPSLQQSLVSWLDEKRAYLKASENLAIQDEASKMLAFRYQAEKVFGDKWQEETDFATGLQKWMLSGIPLEIEVADLLIGEIESFSKAIELVEAYQSNASQGDDWKPAWQKPTAHELIIQNWINPIAPMWLMTNVAISSVVGEEHLKATSVSTTLERLGLTRLKQQPVRSVVFVEADSDADEPFFRFSCASHVKNSPGLSNFLECPIETKRFTFTSDHFLRQDE